MHVLKMNLTSLYNLVCQLEYILLFVKFILKLLTLKINLNHQYHNKHHVWENIQVEDSIFANYHHLAKRERGGEQEWEREKVWVNFRDLRLMMC